MLKYLLILLLIPSLCFSTDCYIICKDDIYKVRTLLDHDCVKEEEVIEIMNSMISRPIPMYFTTAECNPCKCPVNMSDCYKYLADQEKAKELELERRLEVLDRLNKYGMCK